MILQSPGTHGELEDRRLIDRAEHSGFFDDMLSLQGVGSDAEVIEVDARASSLQLFLDLISSSEKTKVSLQWSEYSVCFEVLELAHEFDYKTLEERILAAVDLSAQTPEGYWKLLVKTSHQNDFMLGRAALRQLNRSRVIGKPIWDRLKNLDVIWFWYIRNALFAESGGPGTTPQRHLKLDSIPNESHPHVEWIDQFDPYGRQEEWGSDIRERHDRFVLAMATLGDNNFSRSEGLLRNRLNEL